MASDGAALEDDIVTALGLLLDRHRAAKAAPGTITHGVLDVVNLSLGYYHETPDEADDTALHDLLQDFADEGVVVVACAGNDATRARFFPAAFAAPGHDGLVGVGATNPDDRSIALFSNVGDWVTAHAPGAGVVSTVPITLSGSLNPALSVDGFGPGPRAGVDFDDFRSGFAVWSGTSFASPWIVGEIAAEIVRQGSPKHAVGSPSRARAASGKVVRESEGRPVRPKEGVMAADDTVQTLATRAASAFSAYRDGDVAGDGRARRPAHPGALAHRPCPGRLRGAWPRTPCRPPGCGSSRAVSGSRTRRPSWAGSSSPCDARPGGSRRRTAARTTTSTRTSPTTVPDPSTLALRREGHRVLWAHFQDLPAEVPGAAARHRLRRPARLRRGLRGAQDADGKHRPDPRTLPRQAPHRSRQ